METCLYVLHSAVSSISIKLVLSGLLKNMMLFTLRGPRIGTGEITCRLNLVFDTEAGHVSAAKPRLVRRHFCGVVGGGAERDTLNPEVEDVKTQHNWQLWL